MRPVLSQLLGDAFTSLLASIANLSDPQIISSQGVSAQHKLPDDTPIDSLGTVDHVGEERELPKGQ